MDLDLVSASSTDESEDYNAAVQIPKELLKKLLSSVESVEHIQNTVKHLQQAVSRRETDNNSLKTELQALQDRDGPKFPQFPRLPPEIRRMIWTSAFMIPKIHIIQSRDREEEGEDGARCSRHTQPLLNVCKESRDVVNMLQTPFTWLVRHTDREEDRQFINCNIDTIWLIGELPEMIYQQADHVGDSIISRGYEKSMQSRLHCLVLTSFDWDVPCITSEDQHCGAVDTLCLFGSPRHVYILVGPAKVTCPSKLRFVEPSWSPIRGSVFAAPDSVFTPDSFRGMTSTITWQELAHRTERLLKQFKEACSMSEEKFLEAHGFELDLIDFDPGMKWEVPKISYVEAVEYNPDWIEFSSHYRDDGADNSEDGFL